MTRGIRGGEPSRMIPPRPSKRDGIEYQRWLENLSDAELLHEIRLTNGAPATKMRAEAKRRNIL